MRRTITYITQELIDSLKKSLKMNDEAMEFVSTIIEREESNLKYNENDEIAKYSLGQLKYIETCLQFLDKSYREKLKDYGVRL